MATKEQVETVLQQLGQSHPAMFLHSLNATQAGMGAVIRFLHESEEPVSAGAISTKLGVSTARVAVLLKKMDAKGLIVRQSDANDKRVTKIRLSDAGMQTAEKLYDDLYHQVETVINALGIDQILNFAQIARQLQGLVHVPGIDL